jgi:thiol-disulfide isomerase/thioredoxin
MTKIENPPRRRFVLPAVLAALAAFVAAAVLYGTVQPTGKVAGDCPTNSSRLAAKLAPMAKGELAALTFARDPHQPEQFAFEREGGGKLTLAEFRGRAVLLNLWATWCAPCRAEMPALDRLEAASGDQGFEVVAVNVDTARLERRAAFLDRVGVKALARYADPSGDAFEVLRKDGKALGLPVTLIIDKDGCEIGTVEGPVKWDSAEAEALIGALKGG